MTLKSSRIFRGKWLLALVGMLPMSFAVAQLTVSSGLVQPEDHINGDLNMAGYSVSNVQFSGSELQLGGFTGGGTLGIESGMVLSTHDVRFPDPSFNIADNYTAPFNGPYSAGTAPPALQQAVVDWLDIIDPVTPGANANDDVYDFTSLSFDLVAMGDSLLFDLVFASDEYQFYLGGWPTNRNDLFALFISGPGLSGSYASPLGFPDAINAAVVPGTGEPITPNTVDPVMNFTGLFPEDFASIAGYSVPMALEIPVECGATYHVQLILADQVDHTGGSYVFLRCDGQSDEAVLLDWEVLGFQQETEVLYEGCGVGEITFTRPEASAASEALDISVSYAGTATVGLDCSVLPTALEFNPGETEVVWSGIEAYADLVFEGVESLVINLDNPAACEGNGGVNTYAVSIADEPPAIEVDMTETRVCPGGSAVVVPSISGGYGNYQLQWCDGSTLDSLVINNIDDYLGCQLTVGDTCGLALSTWPLEVEVVQMPGLFAGVDTVVCSETFELQGAILDLPEPQCSSDAGANSYCYGNSAYDVITYCPDFPGDGTFMNLTFLQGSVDVNDEFWIYDGENITDMPLAGPISGDLSGLVFEAQNSSGCLTILVDSNSGNSCQSGTQTPWLFSVGCNATSGYDIAWSPAEAVSDSSDLNAQFTVDSGGEIALTLTLLEAPNCEVTESVAIAPSFSWEVTPTNPTCFDPDGSIQVAFIPIAGSGPWAIELHEGGELMESVVTPLTAWSFDGLGAGDYEVVVSNEHCTYAENLILVAQPEATISLSEDTLICIGGMADLVAVSSIPELDLEWTWSNAVTDSVQQVSPVETTVYSVYASLIPGCNTDLQEITVTVADSLSFAFTPSSTLCLGDSLELAATMISGGLAPYAWNWSSNAFTVDYSQGTTSQWLAPTLTTTYCLELSDACESPAVEACSEVFVPEDLDPMFTSSVISGCFPLAVDFEGVEEDVDQIANALWQFGDGLTSSQVDSALHNYSEIGWYSVSYAIESIYGCTFEYFVDSLIRVNPWPIAEFAADPWEQTLPGNRVEFTNYSLGAVSYHWDFAGLEVSTAFEPEFYFPEQGGEYPVELVATNEWGCADSTAYYIWLIDSFALFVPNAFTPDNDGQNDAWAITGQDVDKDHFHVRVWNRWGQLVYESRDIDEVWLGEFEQGDHYSQIETYFYEIEAKSQSTAADHKVQGHVTVVR